MFLPSMASSAPIIVMRSQELLGPGRLQAARRPMAEHRRKEKRRRYHMTAPQGQAIAWISAPYHQTSFQNPATRTTFATKRQELAERGVIGNCLKLVC